MSALIAVSGATGELGGRVAQRLAAVGARQRMIVRNGSRPTSLPDAETAEIACYSDPLLRSALSGVETLYLVSAREAPDRVEQHRNAIDAAAAAGVGRVVYVSFVSASVGATFTWARDHAHTEDHIRASGLRFTILRSSPYLDLLPFLPSEDGVIRAPAGSGLVSPVSRDDIADTAVQILLGDRHDGQTYDLTGPELITFADIAAMMSDASGSEITYVPETLAEAQASRASSGAPRWQVDGWISSYVAIARGEMAVLSTTVSDIAGHEPIGAAAWLAQIDRSTKKGGS
jgi:uncharacterized protein YbjT (DUF2867 family)